MSRSARRSAGAESASATSGSGAQASESAGVTVEEIGGCFLLRPADERPDEQIELIGAFAPDDDVAVVVVAVPDDRANAMWPRLGEVLTQVRGRSRPVVLAMSDAGRDRPDRAALARRIADSWELTVVAPAGDVVLVPGGTMFTHAAKGEGESQWWSFAPDTEPTPLGLRWPAPVWRGALADVAISPNGPVLTAVPAGMLIQRQGTPAPTPGDLAYAIPAAGDRPSVLVDGKVTAFDLISVLSGPVSKPDWQRHPLRLVPAGDGDLLPLGQAVARDLGIDVEVLTGPPVDLSGPSHGPAGQQVMLMDEAGRPTWSPFAASVLCRPADRDGVTPPLRPLDWSPPADGMRIVDAERGVLRLGDAWRIAVTRAGLWAYPADADPEHFPDRLTAAWPVAAGVIRVDVGAPDHTLNDQVWPLLDDLLGAVLPGSRARPHLAVHGTMTAEGEEAVRKLAARYGAGVEPVQSPSPSRSAEGTAAPVRTVAASPAPAASAAPAPAPDARAAAAIPAVAAVTVTPGRRSTDEERDAFRAMVGLGWDSHAAPVRRTFSRLPAIAATERAAAAVDLVAVRLYLTSRTDGQFGPAAIRAGGAALEAYLSCLASGLGRLPTYRGAVLHGVDAPVRSDLVGSVLTEPGPVGGLPLAGDWPPTATVYVIWSDTARRVAALFDPEADDKAEPVARRGDVVFGPGTRFAVLDVRPGDADTPDLVLLRELAATAFPEGSPGDAAPGGRLALTRLEEALEGASPGAASSEWPAHCLGPIGVPGQATQTAGG
ncbi:hypothetical protein [Actinomadura sp. DC4]|uniref:hypothetical protein n=1 Tax=Actinomadura sp. DC4 TaxID=3055069 RepID=UPI0025B225A4|nr:hypothetical protein [Actinomadura sp. DC4]MDN3359221.1 hypothetical protein [Actinomadura sp. DC4]